MKKRRCSLCGGKLVNNKCVECGLDNSKSDASYRINESRCDYEPLTHVHEETGGTEEKKESYSSQKTKQPVQKTQKKIQKQIQKQAAKKYKSADNKKGKRVGTIVAIIGILVLLINGVSEILNDHDVDKWIDGSISDYTDYEYNPYALVEKTLPESGEMFDEIYTGGEYIVGLHIPEGQYRVETLSGDGVILLDDDENHIYYSEFLSEVEAEGSVKEIEDFRLFTGAKVSVPPQLKVRFVSENAQILNMTTGIANPLTERVELQMEEPVIAGTDFPAGVYDVTFRKSNGEEYGIGYMEYIVPGTVTQEEIEEYGSITGSVMLTEQEQSYKNLVLPEGTEIGVNDGIIILTPSEVIESEDYASYYAEQYIE